MGTLVGCSSEPEEFEWSTTPTPQAKTTDERFLDTVHSTRPSTLQYDDDAVIDVAHLACDVFDDGGTTEDLLDAVLQTGVDVQDAGVIVGAGVGAYCPEHNSKVQ